MTHFEQLRMEEQTRGSPSPDLLAAQFGLTGLDSNGEIRAGITITPDVLDPVQQTPFIRRDIDSVLGYSRNIPLSDAVHYYPYPNPSRTLERRVHVKHALKVDGQVRTSVIL
jgi:hypothetical protein